MSTSVTIGEAVTRTGQRIRIGVGVKNVDTYLRMLERLFSSRPSQKSLQKLATHTDPLLSMSASRRLGVEAPVCPAGLPDSYWPSS